MDKSTDFLDIVRIVSQYVRLAPEGESHYIGHCPFCTAEEDSLILSVDTQYWHCLSCGANGDRYDFVARSENISRAEAILMIGHHTNTGDPFPHARFKPAKPSAKVAEAPKATAPPSAKPPEAPKAQAAQPAPPSGVEKVLLKPFLEFRNIVPSYQGAALLDDKSRTILSDSEYPSSAELAGVGALLATALVHTATMFTKWGMGAATLPAQLILASENSAILVHKFGQPAAPRLLLIRLANPSDVAVARRLVASASAKLV
jgi:hypothetical protein